MYTLEDFLRQAEDSAGLVCYGIGKRFRVFEQCFRGTKLLDKVIFCVDRNEEMQGTKICLGDRTVDVLPVEALSEMREKNIVLLITNFRYHGILSDLSEQNLLPETGCYCFSHLYGLITEEQAMAKTIPADCRITKEAVIPKVIHYCWFGHNPIPDRYKRWMDSWHKYCPDYEIREWNEDNYDITKNRYMYEAYQSKKWGFVPDYARLDIVYEYGGIYLDTDVELVQSLDDMLYQKAFAGFESPHAVNLGIGFGAMKGLPVIKEMRDVYDTTCFLKPDGTLNLTASPVYQTEFLKKRGLQLNGEYQKLGEFVIYPEKMFCGKSFYSGKKTLASYTKSIHHYDASWMDDEDKKQNSWFEEEMNGGILEFPKNLNNRLPYVK